MKLLHQLVGLASDRLPDAIAVQGPDSTYTFSELDALANRVARMLEGYGVSRGDRVALWGEKSAWLIVTMQAVLRLGAVYVPIMKGLPAEAATTILANCGVNHVVTDRERFSQLLKHRSDLTGVLIEETERAKQYSADPIADESITPDDLAYILYTSGSTGEPKGVCVSHRNAMAFIEWAALEVGLDPSSRLANHSSFNFDLSVFDIYGAFYACGRVVLVPESIAISGNQLVNFIDRERISVWYSVPSALLLMMQEGKLLTRTDLALRTIIFAGEVFPIRPLRSLREAWPHLALWNFYGPTETNVCTAYKVTTISADRLHPVPIGRSCSDDRVWLDGTENVPGAEGELLVQGPTVMLGYWGKEPQGDRPYRTGDICRIDDDGEFVFVSRKDNMVKVKGYRIELGEIEAVLSSYPGLREVAVIKAGEGVEAVLVAFFVTDGSTAPNVIELKKHCAKRLPNYKLVNLAWPLETMPRTANGKVDRLRLNHLVQNLFEEKRKEYSSATVIVS